MSKDDKVVSIGAKRKHEEENEDGVIYCSFCHRPNLK